MSLTGRPDQERPSRWQGFGRSGHSEAMAEIVDAEFRSQTAS
jgi:hypothetical protein